MNKEIKAWMYVPEAKQYRYYGNGMGNISVYIDRASAKRNATPNMLENAVLTQVLITPIIKKPNLL